MKPNLLFNRNLLYFFVPFSDVRTYWADPLLILLSVVWALIVTAYELTPNVVVDDLNTLTGVLTSTLGFLLPLYLTTCIDKNKRGIELYDSFCGDVIALAWEVAAYGDHASKRTKDICDRDESDSWKQLKKDIFKVLEFMPDTIKHVFRGDFEYHYLDHNATAKNNYLITDKTVEELMEIDIEMREATKKKKKYKTISKEEKECEDEDNNPIEAIMFYLVIKLRQIPIQEDDKDDIQSNLHKGAVMQILMKKWNDIYSSYGSTASLINYKEPLLFSYVLYTAIMFYIFLLPFTFSEISYSNVVVTFLVIYFFLSLNTAGKLLQNPFKQIKHDLNIFQTVHSAAKTARCLIRKIEHYGKRKNCRLQRQNAMNTVNPNANNLRWRPYTDLKL